MDRDTTAANKPAPDAAHHGQPIASAYADGNAPSKKQGIAIEASARPALAHPHLKEACHSPSRTGGLPTNGHTTNGHAINAASGSTTLPFPGSQAVPDILASAGAQCAIETNATPAPRGARHKAQRKGVGSNTVTKLSVLDSSWRDLRSALTKRLIWYQISPIVEWAHQHASAASGHERRASGTMSD